MAEPQFSSISSFVKDFFLTQAEEGVSKNDPLKNRCLFFSFFQIRPCGVMCVLGKKSSSQRGNYYANVLRSSLLSICSILSRFLVAEG